MFRLQYSDKLFWGSMNIEAGYIHSFTTKREFKSRALGYKILNKICDLLLNSGYYLLRLDCDSHAKSLHQYYEDYGFREVATATVHNYEAVLFEKFI